MTTTQASVLQLNELPADWANYDLIVTASMLEYVPRERLADDAADLHLRDADALADLGLRQVLDEAQAQDLALARADRAQQPAQRGAILGEAEALVVAADRVAIRGCRIAAGTAIARERSHAIGIAAVTAIATAGKETGRARGAAIAALAAKCGTAKGPAAAAAFTTRGAAAGGDACAAEGIATGVQIRAGQALLKRLS